MAHSSLIAFSLISSTVRKRCPFKVVLSLGNRKKSAARIGWMGHNLCLMFCQITADEEQCVIRSIVQQTGRQMILLRKRASIPWFQSDLSFFRIQFWFVKDVTKYLNTSTLSNELLSVYILWLRPASWSRYMIMYLVLSAFMFSSVSLLATRSFCVFIYNMYASAQYINIISINQKLMWPFNFSQTGLPRPSYGRILWQSSKAKAIKHPLVSNHSQ